MTMITPSYLGETIEYSSLHACRSTLEDPTCRERIRSDRFLVLNGDDLYGAADLDELARQPAGLLVQPVEEPRKFGIAFLRPDGTLEKLVEKPSLDGRQLANAGAYVFPRDVFEIELTKSSRGEYEITDYVSALARARPVSVVQTHFWLPIGDVEIWQAAQKREDLEAALTAIRG